MTLLYALAVISCALIIGFAKGGLSGIAIICAPLLGLFMPIQQAVALLLPLLLVGDAFAVWAFRGQWDNALIRLTLPAGIAGAVFGAYVLTQISDGMLRQIIGWLTLIYVGYRIIAYRLKDIDFDPPRPVAYVAGVFTGIASSLANAGAPPLAAYLLLKRIMPVTFVAIFALYFAVVNVVKLPLFLQSGLLEWESFLQVIWAAPFVPLGVWLGRIFVQWVEPRVFEVAILIVLFVTGISLLTPL
ncbi:MAG: sulfite exporter TauE/SafE family protein [Chloroflexota bacterium]